MAFSEQLESPPWRLNVPTDRLTQGFEWINQKEHLPVMFRVAIFTTLWLARVEAFRRLEEEAFASDEYHKSIAYHRATITQLISEGEKLILVAKENGLAETMSGVTLKDLEATAESLHITFQCQHRNNLHPKRREALAELFGDAS